MQPGDDQERLRRMLKDLPKVPARPDFEERLQRRIAGAGRERRSWFAPRRWPALAYSALTVLLVGVVSYLALERAGLRDTPPPPATLSDSAVLVRPAPRATAPPGPRAMPQVESPASATPAAKLPQSQKKAQPEQEYRLDQQEERALVDEQDQQIQEQVEGQEQVEVQEQRDAKVQQEILLNAARAGEQQQKAAEPAQILGIDAERAVTSAHPAPVRSKPRPHTATTYSRMAAPEDTLLTGIELALIDSIARTDSVKADSLRKALLLMRRPKKP